MSSSDCDYNLSSFMLLTPQSDCENSLMSNLTSNSLTNTLSTNSNILIESINDEQHQNKSSLLASKSIKKEKLDATSNKKSLDSLSKLNKGIKESKVNKSKVIRDVGDSNGNELNNCNRLEESESFKRNNSNSLNESTVNTSTNISTNVSNSLSNQLELNQPNYLLNELCSYELIADYKSIYDYTKLNNLLYVDLNTDSVNSANSTNSTNLSINSSLTIANTNLNTNQDQLSSSVNSKIALSNEPDAFKLTYALLTKGKSNRGKFFIFQ